MKTIIFICLVHFGLSLSLFGQSNIDDLLDSSKQWNILEQVWENPEVSNSLLYENTISKRFNGDTIINGKNFIILEESVNDSLYNSWTKSGYYFRQEKFDSIVYVYDELVAEESLLYDFSLLPGDSLITNFNFYVVDSIKHELIGNKEKLVQYFSKEYIVYRAIEGIGTLEDILSPLYWGNTGQICFSKLLCFYKNSTLIYNSEDFCFVQKDYTQINNPLHVPTVLLFPNPASSFVYINIPDSQIGAYAHLISIDGRYLYSMKLNSTYTKFDLVKYDCGLYTVQLRNENQILTNLKLFIQ